MPKIKTYRIENYLTGYVGEKIGNNFYRFGNTVHMIYINDGKVVAFENTIKNEIHIFHTTDFLSKFMQNNWWTYDKICDYESGGLVINTPTTEEGKLYDSEVKPNWLHQRDADKLHYMLLTKYRLDEAGEDEQ